MSEQILVYEMQFILFRNSLCRTILFMNQRDYALDFLESVKNSNDSFLMVLATPAPHAPFTPEPKYRGRYEGIKVPRTPNFNTHKLKVCHVSSFYCT